MSDYSEYDYLCNEPFYIEGIGNLKSPTLRDIRKITFNMFSCYVNLISISKDDYIRTFKLEEQYKTLSEEEKDFYTLYKLMMTDENNMYFLVGIISFFVVDKFKFDKDTLSFNVYQDVINENGDTEEKLVGHIGDDNFETFRLEVQKILGVAEGEIKPVKFRNKLAEQMYARMQEHAQKQQKRKDKENSMENMVKKYCTHNKVGINMLNVWDMTYFQFKTMFTEYCNGRTHDNNDMMAANTFSYKKQSDYKPMAYLKEIT